MAVITSSFCVALYIKRYLPINGVEKSLIFLFCLVDPVVAQIKTLRSKAASFDVTFIDLELT